MSLPPTRDMGENVRIQPSIQLLKKHSDEETDLLPTNKEEHPPFPALSADRLHWNSKQADRPKER